jgi:hypothetical protein
MPLRAPRPVVSDIRSVFGLINAQSRCAFCRRETKNKETAPLATPSDRKLCEQKAPAQKGKTPATAAHPVQAIPHLDRFEFGSEESRSHP